MTLRALIVDDEPLARERIRELLRDEEDVRAVGEAGSGREALRWIEEARERGEDADLLFLDVRMPGLDGIGLIRTLLEKEEPLPAIVFVTAWDEFAVEAFDVHAVDYLLKPVEDERFRRAVARVRTRVRPGATPERLTALLRTLERSDRDRIVVKGRGRTFLVHPDEIDWIEAEGNYATLHAGERDHLVRATLTELEERLAPLGFVRIHRSHLVNLDRVREIRPWSRGDHVVLLSDGTRLSLTRRYRPGLEERLGREI